jgi:hypothetical protein
MDATLSIGEGPCYGAGPSEGRIPPAPQAGTHPDVPGVEGRVGVGGLEPPTSASQTRRASVCATPRSHPSIIAP